MRIFLSAGEPSGDLHAANLVRSLRKRLPDAEFVGFGGPHLARAGAQVLYPLTELAIMWFIQVFQNIRTFFRLLKQADDYFRDQKPDAVILIDYPGFHWHLARCAKRRGIPVIYFVPPQLWAWAGWRIEKLKRSVDLVLCTLPFETGWYKSRGYNAVEYVGHPYFDEVAERPIDHNFLADEQSHVGPVVAILPGSRSQEISRNLPAMLRAAARVASARPDARFVVSCLHERHAALVRGTADKLYRESREHPGQTPTLDPSALPVYSGRTPELIRLADVAWSVSGSVSLELMHETLPTVILYTVKSIDLIIARPFIRTRYITLVNLLAGAEVMPEYLIDRDASAELADWALTWINDPLERGRVVRRLAELKEKVAKPGASERAAQSIAEFLGVRSASSIYRGPHDRARVRRPGSGGDDSGDGGNLGLFD
jgi:lipid-A-disaccharide synthase